MQQDSSLPYEITLITNNLPSGYHRDLQLLKEGFFSNSKPESLSGHRYFLHQRHQSEGQYPG
jgi:hypothetical protein